MLRMLLVEGMRIILPGLLAGVLASLVLTRVLKGLLYYVSPTDPLTFAAVTIALATAALTATLVPAKKVLDIDPIEALRQD
jgi:putative ABC transport system permease protein